MRKIFFLALLLLQLAATAYAYTNKEDGFKTLSPSSDNYIEAAGSHFYGFNDGITAGYAEAIMPEQADKFLGSSFNTEKFNQKYEDISLLQRNGISIQRINKLIANPFVSPLIAFTSTDDLEYSISAQKFGKNKYIAVAINDNTEKDSEPVIFYYTSANDRLYLLLAENSLADIQNTDNMPEKTVGVIGGADAATAITVTDKNAQAPVFLKKFKTIKPQPESHFLSFSDKITGYNVSLPDDWFYLQLKANYNEQSVCLSAALPFENLQELLSTEVLGVGISDIDTAIDAASANANTVQENKDKFFGSLRHGILLGSIKMRDSSESDKIFSNPNQSVLETKQILEELKTYFIDNKINLKTYDYDVDIADGQGSFYLQTELNPADSGFYYRLFAEGKVFTETAFLALVFDRTDDSESMAYKFWNNKAVEQ